MSTNPSVNQKAAKFVKIGEASQILGVSIDTLRRWEKAGKIETVRTPGGTRLYKVKSLAKIQTKQSLSANKSVSKHMRKVQKAVAFGAAPIVIAPTVEMPVISAAEEIEDTQEAPIEDQSFFARIVENAKTATISEKTIVPVSKPVEEIESLDLSKNIGTTLPDDVRDYLGKYADHSVSIPESVALPTSDSNQTNSSSEDISDSEIYADLASNNEEIYAFDSTIPTEIEDYDTTSNINYLADDAQVSALSRAGIVHSKEFADFKAATTSSLFTQLVTGRKNRIYAGLASILLLFILAIPLFAININSNNGTFLSYFRSNNQDITDSNSQVLAESTISQLNKYLEINADTSINGSLAVEGEGIFAENLTAPNIIYSVIAGQNITISGDPQNPTISATGGLSAEVDTLASVTSRGASTTTPLQLLGGITGNLNLTDTLVLGRLDADPSSATNGATYYNTTDNKFRCYINGSWGDCDTDTDTIGSTTTFSGFDLVADSGTAETVEDGDVLSILGGNGITTTTSASDTLTVAVNTGNGLTFTGAQLTLAIPTSGTSAVTSSNSGLELTTDGIALIRGCGHNEIMKWDAVNEQWECGIDQGLSGAVVTIKDDGVDVSTVASIMDFTGNNFDLTESPAGQVNVRLSAVPQSLTGTFGNFDVAGTLVAGTGNSFAVSAAGTIAIASGQTLTIGTTSLNESTSASDSGAFLVGVFDEFANSTGTNVQDVLDDLDAAIGSGASKFTQATGFIYLTNETDDFVLGGTTIANGSLYFDESAGNLAVGTEGSLNGMLTLRSSGAVTDPTITTDSTGNIIAISPNFNTTSTGINSTAIGQTTAATGSFTSITASGTLTANGSVLLGDSTSDTLTFNAVVTNFTANSFLSLEGATADGFETTLNVTDPTADNTITIPNNSGTVVVAASGPLSIAANGTISCSTCLTTGSGYVASLNGLSGALSIANASGVGSTITIDDATTTTKGIASFATANFAVTTGSVTIKSGGVGTTEIANGTVANVDLTNSSINMSYGTGLSGDASVALGGTLTINNTGVTSNVAGTGISVSGGTGAVTITNTGVLALDGGTGTIAVANATFGTGTLTIDNAAADGATKGIAAFNSTNFTASSGVVNTIQDIATSSTPTFAGLTLNGALAANGNVTLGDAAADLLTFSGTIQGASPFVFEGATANAFETTLNITDPTADQTITIPNNSGTVVVAATGPLAIAADGTISCTTCLTSGGGSYVTSLNGLQGALTIANASGVGSTITIDDATTTTKGIASFATANFAVTLGAVTIKSGGVGSTEIANGSVANIDLANSSINMSYGTGVSGDASVALGGTLTINNTGVTSNVAGSGISVSGATGAVTITNTGVTSITGTANQVIASGSTGAVTLSLPQNINTGATPTFAGMTLTGALAGTTGAFSSSLSAVQSGNTSTDYALYLKRNTDTTPAGFLIQAQNAAANANLFAVDINGLITTASVNSASIVNGSVANADLVNSSITVNTSGPLSGGGSVSLGGSLTLDCTTCVTDSTTLFTLAATSGSSSTITSGDTATIAAGAGISTTGNGSGTVTIANTGVTSNVAGTGISVSGATGAVTITNAGVTSITGTANQVIASASTGAVTLSLPQDIHTGATPTFAGLTLTPTTAAALTLNQFGTGAGQTGEARFMEGGASSTQYVGFKAPDSLTTSATYTLPNQDTSAPSGDYVLTWQTGNVLEWKSVGGAGGGDITDVIAGSGLTGGGSTGSVTLDIGAGNGISVASNDISVDSTTTGTTAITSSNSGIESTAGGIRLLGGCQDNEVLAWDSGSSIWACSSISGAGGGTITAVGDVASGAAFSGLAGNTLYFEGATANAFEIALTAEDATVDESITLPAYSGIVLLSQPTANGTSAAQVAAAASGPVIFINETGAGTPNLIQLQTAGADTFVVTNAGLVSSASIDSTSVVNGSIANVDLANSSITFTGDSGSGAISLGGTLTFDGDAAQGVSATYSAGTLALTVGNAAADGSTKGVAAFNATNFSATSGVVAIANNGVALGTQTTGDYVGTITGSGTITSSGATSGEGIAHILSVTANSIGGTQLASTVTFADGDYIDLSAVLHDDAALQGLRLPNTGPTPTNPTSGEGNIAYDATNGAVIFYDGSTWQALTTAVTAGDITDVIAGSGLTGGGSTGAVTLNVGGSSTITVNANDIAVTADSITDTELAFNTGQHLTTTSAVTFSTVDTGQGANELYDMDQDVLTTSSVTFNSLTLTTDLSVANGGTGASSLTGILIGNGTGAFTATTVSSGISGQLSDETGTGALVFGTAPSLTSPSITTGITDSNGNELFNFNATGSAVNELTFANAATTTNPSFTAVGSDTNIGLDLILKGAGVTNFGSTIANSDILAIKPQTGTATNTFTGTITSADLTAARTYTLPDASGTFAVSASAPLALSAAGNLTCASCVTSATTLFTLAATSGSSSTIVSGDTVTVAAGTGITSTGNGSGTVTIANSGVTSNVAGTGISVSGATGAVTITNTGVTSLDGGTGSIAVANATFGTGTLTIDDASAVAKGIASFNATNFTVTAGDVVIATGGVGATELAATTVAANSYGGQTTGIATFTVDADGRLTTAGTTTLSSGGITDNTITATDLASTLTFADGDYIDLSAILHDDTALQGFRLPNTGATPSVPVSGEGQIAYDATNNNVIFYNGTAWQTITTSATGDITSVVAGSGLTGGGTSGDVTLTIGGSSTITVNADDIAVTANSIGDTELAFNTGQDLTTASSPTFAALTLTAALTVPNGGTGAQTLTGLLIGNGTGAFTATTVSSGISGQISDETGTGALVFATSPSFTTPSLGVATATTINNLTITTPATGSTLTIADGKTFTASNSLTFTGTDATSFAFPSSSGTVCTTASCYGTASTLFNTAGTTGTGSIAGGDTFTITGNATQGVSVALAGDTFTATVADATTSTKGVASYDTNFFTVTSGAVSVAADSLDFTEFKDTLALDANQIVNQGTNTWTQNFTGTTTNGLTYNANNLTSGQALSIASTSTALTTGGLMSLDWSPGSATTATGDLFALNIGTNGTVGNIFNIKDSGSSIFSVSETALTSNIPVNFTSPGDVAIAYDLNFTNSTASFINSQSSLNIVAGEIFNSSNLYLRTYNQGTVVIDSGATTGTSFELANNNLTTGTAANFTSSSITSGSMINVAQTTSTFTGNLAQISLGNGSGTALNVTNAGTGYTFRANDDGTYTDSTPFIIEADGDVLLGGTAETLANTGFVMDGNDLFVAGMVGFEGDIYTDGDLNIGLIGLNDVGSSNITSGASLVGTFDEFTNSNSTTVQDVLDDLDAAISGAGTGDITAVGNITTGDAFTTGTPGGELYFADNGFLGLGAAAGRIEFDDQTTDEVNFLNSKVGIGTSTPQQELDVRGIASIRDTGGTGWMDFSMDGTTGSFNISNVGTTAVFAMILNGAHFLDTDTSGNVNIGGDTSPNSKFTVGSTSQFQVDSSGAIAAATGITSSGSITFSGLTASRAVFTTTGGLLTSTGASADLSASLSDETGSGAAVFATSPTLVTPTLGVATATTINNLTITAPATGSTLTVADGKTFTASNTLTFTGTDATSFAFPATSGTVCTTASCYGTASTLFNTAGTTGTGSIDGGDTFTITGNSTQGVSVALSGDTFTATVADATTSTKGVASYSSSFFSVTSGDVSIAADSLDFTEFQDTLDLDANQIVNQGTNTWTQNFTGTTTNGLTYNADSLSSGEALVLSSTSTALTSGGLASLDWSPGSTTTATGDLFALNIGANGTTSGNLFNIKDSGSSIFAVSETQFTTSLPANFTASGDTSFAYDIQFTNPVAAYIKSNSALTMAAGEVYNSSNLTLQTYNNGTVVIDSGATTGTSFELSNNNLTTGTAANFTSSSVTSGSLLNIAQTTSTFTGNLAAISLGTGSGTALSVANGGTGYSVRVNDDGTTTDSTPIVFDATGNVLIGGTAESLANGTFTLGGEDLYVAGMVGFEGDIFTDGDLNIGAIGLNDVGSSNTTSGASLVGVFDEFDHSIDPLNVQNALDDLDAAITAAGSGASKWSVNTTPTPDTIYPTGASDSTGYDFAIGGTASGAQLFFDTSAGDLSLVGDIALATGQWLGLGASAGRIEFDDQTTDEINFLTANVGIGTSTPAAKLDVLTTSEQLRLSYDASNYASLKVGSGGELSIVPTGGFLNVGESGSGKQLRFWQMSNGTAVNSAYIRADYNNFYLSNSAGAIVLETAETEAKALSIQESAVPYASLKWWFDGSSLTGTGMWMKTPSSAGSQNYQLGDTGGTSKFNILNSSAGNLFELSSAGNLDLAGTFTSGTSNAFAISATGVVTTITDETINGLDISAGALSDITGYTQASGAFNLTPDGTNDINLTVANASGRFLNVGGLATGTASNGICLDASNNVITCTYGGGSGTITAVGSMTTGDAFADSTADDDWLGLGAAAGRIEFDDQTTDEVNILGANVGIGDSTPASLLSLYQTTTTGAAFNIYRDLAAASTTGALANIVQANAGDDQTVFYISQNGTGTAFQALNTGTGNTLYIEDVASDTTPFVIDAAGQVGIGTSTPNNALEVLSTTTPQLRVAYDASNYMTTNVSSTGITTFDTVGSSSQFYFNDQMTVFNAAGQQFAWGDTPFTVLGALTTSGGSATFAARNNNDIVLYSTDMETMRIADNGNTNIGGDTVPDALFTVGSTSQFQVNSTGAVTAASVNKVAITAPATSATLTIADGKTLTVSNTLTFTGTDSTSFAFPASSGTVCTTASCEDAITFANGLTRTGDAVALGGALTGNTTITQDTAETLTFSNTGTGETAFDLTSTGDLNIKDNGTAFFSFQDNGTVAYTGGTGVDTETALGLTGNSLTTGTLMQLTATAMTSGSFFDINNGSSIFNVSQSSFTTSLPVNFTSPGDVSIANDIQFTNPTASYIKSYSALTLQAGDPFGSANLTLGTYNEGSVYVPSNVATGIAMDIDANALTTGSGLNISSTSTAGTGSGSSYLLYLDRSGANASASHTAYGMYSSVTNTGTTNSNVAAYLSASGAATNNYALQIAAGTAKFADSTLLDLSSINASSATEGLILPQLASACAAATAEGQVCWDTAGEDLYIGNGTTAVQMNTGGGGSNWTINTTPTPDVIYPTGSDTSGGYDFAIGGTASGAQLFFDTSAGDLAIVGDMTISGNDLTFGNAETISNATNGQLQLNGSAPTASATVANVLIGANAIASGDSDGTYLGLNATTGYAGDYANFQTNSSTVVRIMNDGTYRIGSGDGNNTTSLSPSSLRGNAGMTISTSNGGSIVLDAADGGSTELSITSGGIITHNFNATSGTLEVLAASGATTQAGAYIGSSIDLSTNITNTTQNQTGMSITMKDGSSSGTAIGIALAGTYDTGIDFGGTPGTNLINSSTIDITSAGAITGSTGYTQGSGTFSLTADDGSFVNLSAVNVSSTTEGLILPQNATACSAATGEGQVCWDTAGEDLYIGNGAAAVQMNGGGGSSTWNSLTDPTGTQTLAFGDAELNAWTISSDTETFWSMTADSMTTGKLFDISLDGLTSGIGLNMQSTSTALAGTAGIGSLATLDWSPGSTTTSTNGDLFSLKIGTNGTLANGNIFGIYDGSSSTTAPIFAVSETGFNTSLPSNFTAAGDVAVAYDINFTNPTVSYIKSTAPLTLTAGETFNSSNLTLQTYNQGAVVFDTANTTTTAVDLTSATLTTGIGLNATLSALTTGIGLSVNSASTAVTSGNLLNVAQTGVTTAQTGATVAFSTSATTNSGARVLTIAGNTLTTGTAQTIAANALTTGKGLSVTSSSAAVTSATLLNIAQTGVTTTQSGATATISTTATTNAGARVLTLAGDAMTTGIVQTISANLLTTGSALAITSTSAGRTSGNLFSIAQTGVTTTQSAATAAISTTATTNSGARVLTLTGDAMTTGQALAISTAALTTGSALSLTGPSSVGVTGNTVGFANIVTDVGSTGSALNVVPDFSGSAVTGYGIRVQGADGTGNANTSYGIHSNLGLTGNAAKAGVGISGNVSSSSTTADLTYGGTFGTTVTGAISSGIRLSYGVVGTATNTAANTGGILGLYGLHGSSTLTNATTGSASGLYGVYATTTGTLTTNGTLSQYGLYAANGTSSTTGTSSKYGVYIEDQTGADVNYAFYSAGGTNLFAGDIVQTSGINATGDQESMIPNTGFEVNNDSDTGTADAWTGSTGGTGALTINTSTPAQGSNAQELQANSGAGNSSAILSSCIPVSNSKSYYLYSRAKSSTGTGNGYYLSLLTYSSKANCAANTSATTQHAANNATPSTSYGDFGASITANAADLWARVQVRNFEPSGTHTISVDSVRLIPGQLTQGVDLAENFPVSSIDTPQPGDVVAIGDNSSDAGVAYATKTATQYDQKIFGIVSTQPGLVLDDGAQYLKAKVALAGRVPTRVSTENGVIERGDYLTTSSIPGVAMKATRPGQMVGKALESYSADGIGKITVFVNVSFADPKNVLANLDIDTDGSLIVPGLKTNKLTLDQLDVQTLTVNGSSINLTQLATVSNSITELTAVATTLNDQVEALAIAQDLTNSRILGLETDNAAQAEALAEARELGEQAVNHALSLDDKVASTSSTIDSLSAKIDELLAGFGSDDEIATSSSTPRDDGMNRLVNDDVIASDSEAISDNLTNPSTMIATDSAELDTILIHSEATVSGMLQAYDGVFQNSLKSLGDTMLGNTTIAGDLSVDGTLNITGSTVNSVGCVIPTSVEGSLDSARDDNSCGILFLQNSPLAELVDLFNGAVQIARSGNITTIGEVKAESISTDTLKVTETAQDSSIGSGTIPAGIIEIPVFTNKVGANTKVFVTVTSEANQPLVVSEKIENAGFVVKIQVPELQDITFDWFIVN